MCESCFPHNYNYSLHRWVEVQLVDLNEAQAFMAFNHPCKYRLGGGPVSDPCTLESRLHRGDTSLVFMTQKEKAMGRDYHNIQISSPYHINIIPSPEIESQWPRPSAFQYLCGRFWEVCASVAPFMSTWLHKLLTDISIRRSETISLMESVMPEVILYFI